MTNKSKKDRKVEAEIFFTHTKSISKEHEKKLENMQKETLEDKYPDLIKQKNRELVFKAYKFASKVHANQTRKGKLIPYILHPLSVANRLSRVRVTEETIVAGILHDTIEDSKEPNKISKIDIEREFGADIARMVDDVTEQDRSLPWAERKAAALAHVPNMQKGSLLVKTADVLDNLSDQIEDYKQLGDNMFDSFNASKEEQLKRYLKLTEALEKVWDKNPLLPSLKEVITQVKRLWS